MNPELQIGTLNAIITVMIRSMPSEAIPQVLLGLRSAAQYYETASLNDPISDRDRANNLAEYARVIEELQTWQQQQR